MDSPQKMDVVNWQDSPRPVIPNNRAPRWFLSPTLIGILGTLLLHALVLESVPFGSRGRKVRPAEPQVSADTLDKSKGDQSETLELIPLPTMDNPQQAASQNIVSSRSGFAQDEK